ncbi:MAG: methylmalonyl Co-A mutase-associated GTPase MeaB [Devosiaceae bacterium]|nr:methylmalonyl Co-A mutase-associated GTPase MeaB [Devosiaceae bacterium MH13]
MTPPSAADPQALAAAIASGDRAALARGITLVESRRPDHRAKARALLEQLQPGTGGAVRIGMTGVPGVGKSTTIDAFGAMLIGQGHKVAVLAVDPSSTRTGGSILGDKTRMAKLAAAREAYVRPSPSAGTLGGVTAKSRETILLCEAAGFDVVIVETVGIGQSETTVASMVDVFTVLMLPGAGDELQGIKKGVLEIADIIAINKADGDNQTAARKAATHYRSALDILAPTSPVWKVPVLTQSAVTGEGLETLWGTIKDHRAKHQAAGLFAKRRAEQSLAWMKAMLQERALETLTADAALRGFIREVEQQVADGVLAPSLAVEQIVNRAGW